jgi:hypothetical protein
MDVQAAAAAIAAREFATTQFRQQGRHETWRSNGLERLDVPNEYAVRREGEAASDFSRHKRNGGCSALTRRNVFDSIKRLPLLAKAVEARVGLHLRLCKHC